MPEASLKELTFKMKRVQQILEEVLGAPEHTVSDRDSSSGGGGSNPMAAGGGAPPPPSPPPLARPPLLDFAAALPPLPPPAAFSAAPERPPPPAPPVNVDPPTAEMDAPTIVQLMQRGGSIERVVLVGANALCAHASRSGVVHKSALFGHTSKPNPAAGADSCVAAGAPAALTDALRRHAGSTSVCERACEALRLIVLSHSSLAHADTTHEARAQACTPAIPQLLMMFEAQLGSASTCGNAAAAMTALVTGSNARRDAALAEGATLRLTTVLQRHKGDAAVCEGACGALRVLLVGAERTRALEAGIVPSLISALQRHNSDEAVCVGAGGALDAIIASGAAGRSAVVEAGGVPLLAAAWSAHPEGRVPFSAALRALNYNDRGAWIGEVPAAPMGARRVVEMMAQGLADKRVALAGAEALGAISDPAGGEMECVRADAVPALLTAMRLHNRRVHCSGSCARQHCRWPGGLQGGLRGGRRRGWLGSGAEIRAVRGRLCGKRGVQSHGKHCVWRRGVQGSLYFLRRTRSAGGCSLDAPRRSLRVQVCLRRADEHLHGQRKPQGHSEPCGCAARAACRASLPV